MDGKFLIARGIITVLGWYFRASSHFGPEEKRVRIRAMLEKMERIDCEGKEAIRHIQEADDPLEAIETMEARLERAEIHTFDAKHKAQMRQHRQQMNAVREESAALQKIKHAAESPEAAVTALREYVAAHPMSVLGHSYLSNSLFESGDYDGCLAVLETEPHLSEGDNLMTRSLRARCLQKKGDVVEAITFLRQLLLEDSKTAEVMRSSVNVYLGDALKDFGDTAEARAVWKTALRQLKAMKISAEIKRPAEQEIEERLKSLS